MTKSSENTKKWRLKNPEKYTAHKKVFIEIGKGKLKREDCFCGEFAEAHHEDYSKPLEIKWLCKRHHTEHHIKKRNQDKKRS